ncbi:MAG: hypothetical protein V7K38_01415 [Nostoc sp.]|uniref:hypothetical protein n=1 Tax=Nostoc sp. TaxID=1180 RepID=UPI002FF6873C
MESIKIRTYIGDDGILQIQLPPEIINQELDVVIVFQPVVQKYCAIRWLGNHGNQSVNN